MKFANHTINIRIIVATIVVLSVPLIVVLISHRAASPAETSLAVASSVEVIIQKLLVQYQVDDKSVRTRKVPVGDEKFVRVERRVSVPPEFNAMSFNHDLNNAVSELGATVVATERSEDKSVTMHVKKNGVIVESIVFVVKKG